jgi:hypothetical protein
MLARWSRWLRLAASSTVLFAGVLGLQAAQAAPAREFSRVHASADARRLVDWEQRTQDHRGHPFVVVDKKAARIYVFGADGKLAGESAALLGSTFGDHIVPGVGARAQTGDVRPDERTTPAGRFDAVPGRNLAGEHVVWADYASAFAIHRLRGGRAEKPRAFRLATLTPEDNRASWGCVVVPVAFYEQVVEPVLGAVRSVVYVMPETKSLQSMLNALEQ